MKMKNVIIFIMVIQVILICNGVYLLTEGKIERGIVYILINTLCFGININTLKRYY